MLLLRNSVYFHSKIFIHTQLNKIVVGSLIIADKEGKGYEFAKKVYEKIREKSNDFSLVDVSVARFRDGEVLPQVSENVRDKKCYFVHDSNKRPADWYLELDLINHALKNSSAKSIIDVIPYMKFSRQDRKDKPRVPISARVVADTIGKYANAVLTLDDHNPANQAAYGIRYDNLYSYPVVADYIRQNNPSLLENLAIMSTDVGGAKRVDSFYKILHERGIETEVVICHKRRPKPGEVGELIILGEVKDKNVLIMDDLIDSGGSMVKAAEEARKAGAKKVYGYSTHGIYTKGLNEVLSAFDFMYNGDTLYQEVNPRKEIISFAPLLGEAIYRMDRGESLSELFN